MNVMNEEFFDLDDPTTYAYDPGGVYGWLEKTDRSLEIARKYFFENSPLDLQPKNEITNVVICGMGGSAVSGDLAWSVVANHLMVPCRIVKGYMLPAGTGPGTLLIVVSYSGNTEEAIWCYTQGYNRKADVVTISTGGALADMAARHGVPHLKLECDYPAPRLALTHLLPAVLYVFHKCFGGFDFLNEALQDSVQALKRGLHRYSRDLPFDKNFAKHLAFDIHNAFPVIVSGEQTMPVAMRFAAQLNENGKWPAHVSVIPEMNHNEVVAYGQPGPATGMSGILFLRDKDDHPRVVFRQDFTKDLVEQHVAWVHMVKGEGKTFLGRIFSMLQTADFTSYYLAVARGLDPLSIRAIDTLKERLGKLK